MDRINQKNENMNYMKVFIVLMIVFHSHQSAICQKYKDKDSPQIVTQASRTYFYDDVEGVGLKPDKLPQLSCSQFNDFKETNTIWLKWTVKREGNIAFTITPNNFQDDFDFILFKENDSKGIEEIRCMASGPNLVKEDTIEYCNGLTGLNFNSEDKYESEGCSAGDDNFLEHVYGEEAEIYYLLVNNTHSSEGFSITFEGNAGFDLDNSFNEAKEAKLVSIYPNPTASELNLEIESNATTSTINILDNRGVLLRSEKISIPLGLARIQYDVSDLPSGAYYIQLIQNDIKTTNTFIKG